MVKYDKKNKALKDFESLLEEIMQCKNECFDDEISQEGFEVEMSESSSDSLIKEDPEEAATDTEEDNNTEHSSFSPGHVYSFENGRVSAMDLGNDLSAENEEPEVRLTSEQIKKLAIIDKKEYTDRKNIIKPDNRKKKMIRRCTNFDD